MKKLFIGIVLTFTLVSWSFAGISLRLNGGYGTFMGGDWNKGVQQWNAFIAAGWASHSGSIAKLDSGLDFGAEVVFNLSESFGVGLGAGYIMGSSNDNIFQYTGILSYSKNNWDTKVTAIPITLNLRYNLAIGKSMNLNLYGGAGYYLGKFDFANTYDNYVIIFTDKGTETWKASKGAIGFQGGMALEFKVAGSIFIVVDVGGRYAQMSDLTGDYKDVGVGNFSGSYTTNEQRTLYVGGYDAGAGSFRIVFLSKGTPSATYTNVEKATVSLTGIAAKIGLRIDL